MIEQAEGEGRQSDQRGVVTDIAGSRQCFFSQSNGQLFPRIIASETMPAELALDTIIQATGDRIVATPEETMHEGVDARANVQHVTAPG